MKKISKALEKAEFDIEKEFELGKLSVSTLRLGEKVRPKIKEAGQTPATEKNSITSQQMGSFFKNEFVAAEQFRKLRTNIIRFNSFRPAKTIMVTSAVQGEGKSFVARNLAIGIAHDLHLHSLLVDCDLRNPSQAVKFGLQKAKGISDYLIGDGTVSDLLIKTKVEKLSVLTSGSFQGNPTELLSSKRMENLVEELKSRYSDRYVIFDSTPILATSEPEVLARLVDGIIVVVRAGKTPRETVEHAVSLLGKEKILGLALNDITFKSSGLFVRYFGSNRYYYGSQEIPPSLKSRWPKMFWSKRNRSSNRK